MKYTMAAFSLAGADTGCRYDFLVTAKPNGIAYYRYQTPASRTRWKCTSFTLHAFHLDLSTDLAAGPDLVEGTPEEAQEIENGALHPPRNLGLRAEKVRVNWSGAHLPIGRLDSWLEEWRTATTTGDQLWISARTAKHGRVRKVPGAFTHAATSEKSAASATETGVTAVEGGEKGGESAVGNKAFSYPAIVRGVVVRPNGEHYRVRKIGRKQDVAVLREMREARINVLTFGPSGSGKSAMTEAAFGNSLVTILGSEDTEAADFVGGFTETDNGHWEWTDGPLLTAMTEGHVLYIDEIGCIRSRQLTLVHAVMDGRLEVNVTMNPKRGIVRAAPGFAIVASINPDAPETRMSDALLSRFGFQLEVNSDYKMAREHLGVPEWLCNAAENLELRRVNHELPWAPQLRDLIGFRKNVEIMGDETAALGAMINSAPKTARSTVSEVLSKAAGRKIRALVLV